MKSCTQQNTWALSRSSHSLSLQAERVIPKAIRCGVESLSGLVEGTSFKLIEANLLSTAITTGHRRRAILAQKIGDSPWPLLKIARCHSSVEDHERIRTHAAGYRRDAEPILCKEGEGTAIGKHHISLTFSAKFFGLFVSRLYCNWASSRDFGVVRWGTKASNSFGSCGMYLTRPCGRRLRDLMLPSRGVGPPGRQT